MEKDHKPVDTAKKGDTVAMRIEVRPCQYCLPVLRCLRSLPEGQRTVCI